MDIQRNMAPTHLEAADEREQLKMQMMRQQKKKEAEHTIPSCRREEMSLQWFQVERMHPPDIFLS
jgi:hypothetical protein